MSVPQNSSCSSLIIEDRCSTRDILISESDERFFRSLDEFIEQEKRFLRGSGEEPARFSIYSCVFDKVIGRATAYKRLLLTIKAEYDDVIGTLQRRQDEAKAAQRTLAASTSHSESLMSCQRRAAQLRERICVIHKETAELQEEMKRQKSSQEQCTWIPGLTVGESADPEALDGHLKRLESHRAALLERKSHRVSLKVKAELDGKLQRLKDHRDQLSTKNIRLKVLYKRLTSVSDRLSSWEGDNPQVPLEKLLGSMLENIRQSSVTEEEGRFIDANLFEHEEPTGVDESKLLEEYLSRFIELFDSAEYEEAALHAARSPRGVLRNLDIMEMFQDVKGAPGSAPPLFLFLQALLVTLPAGEKLPAALSLQLVRSSLQQGATRLITHAVNYDKLTFSEDVGDTLTEHAQESPVVADLCLALATTVYSACGLDRKTALTICRRGFIHSAAEFIDHSQDLTADDCLWVLYRSPSLALLQLLTTPQPGRAAILSMGVACSTLLADPLQQQLALQLLDSFVGEGRGGLEEVILQDSSSSVDEWTVVTSLCTELNRADLSQAVLSILLDQSGTGVMSPDPEGARLMEHVFL
uniref:clathrin heavy chain linker domain-containing protein 1-like n=1 Tax=Gasterosteus aculeatus aculeatus TaxID=481459 RepID=UPI001A98054A|nr:clathrin heavy chain linker domain-containing protein 1-like [Gasterosteus aculeatus aculeatus]XP_040035066.1 clathrin heavy chain linker domain-containing protein 1-like [Gasterosteus aculeatus aculeatus]